MITANRQAIQQLWNQGIQDAMEIHNRTNIPLSTIYDNLKKLKNSGTVQHIEGTLSTKLSSTGIDVSYRTIGRHLSNHGYHKKLPRASPMLTANHSIEWAKKHLNND
ncbi:hypothetical protein RCL_jg16059.t1 [Rhizophagus clarus]|uniref:Transposase Tc1-like domain-containing protein n=1 Tax=Rhizophagus clarus TaxID=94130 RepID=A0A8H3LD49_9GLOM|nr:hypothetical protein RCL_jg16059.t1 [Rhizophagus clarus]